MIKISIEFLQKVAELNLCEKCYQKYKALIEPSIKAWRSKPLGNWSEVELHVTAMVMKLEGVFKDEKTIFLSLDEENEKHSDLVDVATFHKIAKWPFKRKIDFLRQHGMLQKNAYKLLDKARKIRNKIHDTFSDFSEPDMELLNAVASVTENIFFATIFYFDRKNVYSMMIANAEEAANQLLTSSE